MNKSIYQNYGICNIKREQNIETKPILTEDNSGILANDEAINIYKEELVFQLEINLLNNNYKKPIVIISDDCFTNNDFISILKDILGVKLFNRYCEHILVDWRNGTFDSKTLEDNIYNNSFIVVGGSFTDVNKIEPNILNSKGVQKLRNIVLSGEDQDLYNNFYMGICFGHQFGCKLKGHNVKPSIEHFNTLKYELKFENMTSFSSELLAGVSNFGINRQYVSPATNRQYVYLNEEKNNLDILASDEDGEIAIVGGKNEKYLSVQHHAELNACDIKDIDYINQNLSENNVKSSYNHKTSTINHNLGITLYLPILTTRLSKINKTFIGEHVVGGKTKILGDSVFLNINEYVNKQLDLDKYKKGLKKSISDILITSVKEHIDEIDSSNFSDFEKLIMKKAFIISSKIAEIIEKGSDLFSSRKELQELLFRTGFGEINSDLDWSVSRDIISASNTFGLKDLSQFIISYNDFLIRNKYLGKDEVFIVRELGPGDATLLRELQDATNLENTTKDKILYYGIGDKVYFTSIYKLLTERFYYVPVDILQVFVYNLFIIFKGIISDCKTRKVFCDKKLEDIVKLSIDYTQINHYDKVYNTTMFGIDVKDPRFSKKIPLTSESIEFLSSEEGINTLNDIKDFIKEDPHNLIQGDFEKVLLAKFETINHTLDNIDHKIKKTHMQFALRATSHLDSDDYKEVLLQSTNKYVYNGGLIIDDGVHQSYTFIVRIKELKELKDKLGDRVEIKLLYDKNTNYSSSAFIQKKGARFLYDFDLQSQIKDNIQILDIDEMSKVTFFKVERYIRETIYKIFNKDYRKLFRNHQSDILDITKFIIKNINEDILNNSELQKKIANMLFMLIISIRQEYKIHRPNSRIFDIDMLKKHSENIFAKKIFDGTISELNDVDFDKLSDDLIRTILTEEGFDEIGYNKELENIFKNPYLPEWLDLETNRKV